MSRTNLMFNAAPTATTVGNAGQEAQALAIQAIAKNFQTTYGLDTIGWRTNTAAGFGVGVSATTANLGSYVDLARLRKRCDVLVANDWFIIMDFVSNITCTSTWRNLDNTADWSTYNSESSYTARPPTGKNNIIWDTMLNAQVLGVRYMMDYIKTTYGKDPSRYIKVAWLNEPRTVAVPTVSTTVTSDSTGTTLTVASTTGFVVDTYASLYVTAEVAGTWAVYEVQTVTNGTTLTLKSALSGTVPAGTVIRQLAYEVKTADFIRKDIAATVALKGATTVTLSGTTGLDLTKSPALIWVKAGTVDQLEVAWITANNSNTLTLDAPLPSTISAGTRVYYMNTTNFSAGTDVAWLTFSNYCVDRIKTLLPELELHSHTFHGGNMGIAVMLARHIKLGTGLMSKFSTIRYNAYKGVHFDPNLPTLGIDAPSVPGAREYARLSKQLHKALITVFKSNPVTADKPLLCQEFGTSCHWNSYPGFVPFTEYDRGVYERYLIEMLLKLKDLTGIGWFKPVASTGVTVPSWPANNSTDSVGVIDENGNAFVSLLPIIRGTALDAGAVVPAGFANAGSSYVNATTDPTPAATAMAGVGAL